MATATGAIQIIVDELATKLGLAVLVDDRELNALCWSSQQEIDAVRLSSILRNTLEPDAIKVVGNISKANAIFVTPEVPQIGMKSRVCAPLVQAEEHVGYLWVLDPTLSVSDDQKVQIRAAADKIVIELANDYTTDHRRRAELIAKLERGHDVDTAISLAILENLPRDTYVVADLHKLSGDWILPDLIAVRPVSSDHAGATSGQPLPLANLGEAVRRARFVRTALASGARLDMDRWDALQSWRLLLEAPDALTPEDLQPNVTKLFQPVHAELLKTAEVFFDLGGDVQSATEALLVHRTTFYYRLGKISDLIGVNLQNDRDKSNLDLALKLHRIQAIRHL